MKAVRLLILLLISLNASSSLAEKSEHAAILKQLQLPPGFKISIFADDVPDARSLALGENGLVFIGTRDAGKVYAVRDQDGDGVAEQKFTIAEKLYMPNGVAYKDGNLYVAEVNRIIRFDKISELINTPPKPTVIYDKFPSDRHHGWKYLRFGPDGKLYSAVGAPCNICEPEKPIYASLVRLDAESGKLEILAHGIRNSVGFDWEPGSGQLFFNDNGRDWLGDDQPPEELNEWLKADEHFGYPYCHAGHIADPEFGAVKPCKQFVPPVWKYKAHIAPLGMWFYRGGQFPEKYHNQLFVAQHGSWNRSQAQGYRIVLVEFSSGKPYAEKDFISGWLTPDNKVLGRPVDIMQMADGSLLISDDKLGVVYKVEYQK